jgi:DNA-binding IclR family transcriptional regulator
LKSDPEAIAARLENAGGTSTLDLALRVLEFLAAQSELLPLNEIAREFKASKATIYRHLVTLQRHGFVRQDPGSGRYGAGVKLMVLAETQRSRFSVVPAARDELARLRDRTEQAVTLCGLIDGKLVVLDLVNGRTIIEFGTRPGAQMALHASAHGKIWLAFGPAVLARSLAKGELKAWTPSTHTRHDDLADELDLVRRQGWAIAPNQVITGVNALAAPIFDFRNELVGSVAIVGATQYIAETPSAAQVSDVVESARRISDSLGWRSDR